MLTDQQDAYGHLIQDSVRGLDDYEVDERDDGYVGVGRVADTYTAPFADWCAHHQRAMGFALGRVLDIGCGAGRHALYLQAEGHEVLATDSSPLSIQTCRERGVKHGQVVPITQLSSRLGVFDTVLMLGNNFGLFGSFTRARWLLRRFRSFTSPGARLIAESTDPYQTTDAENLAYHQRNLRRGRMAGQIRLRIRHHTYATPWFDYLLVSRGEMETILTGTGWGVTEYLNSPGPSYIAIIERTDGGQP